MVSLVQSVAVPLSLRKSFTHTHALASLSWNSMGLTWTPSLGMHRSCNFVNMYTIPYRV